VIRRANATDAAQLLSLMRQLADFEGYADRFAVTESDLLERGLNNLTHPQFVAWVVERGGKLIGYAVTYVIPFTFDLRPTVVLKELFVCDSAREGGYGRELFASVINYAQSINARLLRWQVLPTNERAKGFYRRQGGELDTAWESWEMDVGRARMENSQRGS
jgi:GNAT superfamily N-acetyltransferase